MILVHLSVNGKAAILDRSYIVFAEECTDNENNLMFTRIYLKQPLPGENGSPFIDVVETVEFLLNPNT